MVYLITNVTDFCGAGVVYMNLYHFKTEPGDWQRIILCNNPKSADSRNNDLIVTPYTTLEDGVKAILELYDSNHMRGHKEMYVNSPLRQLNSQLYEKVLEECREIKSREI